MSEILAKATKKDCPLCGKKNALTCSASTRDFKGRPGPKGLIGNYDIKYGGGKWDYSHAKKCPKLKGVREKESLLAYFNNDVFAWHDDLLSFDNYRTHFLEKAFDIKVVQFRKDEVWRTRMYVASAVHPYNEDALLEVESSDPISAFRKLKHRLLCGECFSVKFPKKDTGVWHLRRMPGDPRFISLEKLDKTKEKKASD